MAGEVIKDFNLKPVVISKFRRQEMSTQERGKQRSSEDDARGDIARGESDRMKIGQGPQAFRNAGGFSQHTPYSKIIAIEVRP